MSKYNCIDLFAGAGGFSAGFNNKNFNIDLAVDNFSAAAKSYKANHPQTEFLEKDIEKLTGPNLVNHLNYAPEKIDVLIGGPPCQGFSTVGKRKTEDKRNDLFKDYVRLVDFLKPRYFIMENVTGILNLEDGKFLKNILKAFDGIGYKVKYKTLNAVNYGVPQNRERVFFIGSRDNREIIFPEPTHSKEKTLFNSGLKPPLTLWEAISDLPKVEAGESSNEYATEPQNEYQKERRKNTNKLTLHKATNHNNKMVEMMDRIPEGKSVWEVEDIPQELKPSSGYGNTYARLSSEEPGMTITRNFSCVSSSRCIHPFQNRGLTAREAARIQSFDDDYQFKGTKSKIALQIGNAVPPLLAKEIADVVYEMLSVNKSDKSGLLPRTML